MSQRVVVVCDVESSGLDPTRHEVLEVSYWCMDTGTQDTFIPPHTLTDADPEALAVNNYWSRRLYEQDRWDLDGSQLRRFHAVVTDAWIVGSNPSFDASFLKPLFVRHGLGPAPFMYAPLDVPTYGAGVLGRPISDRVGLTQLCRILGVTPGDHSAAEDVRACAECLIELQHRANYRRAA